MLVGIGFVAVLTAAAASRFLREQRDERSDLMPSRLVWTRSYGAWTRSKLATDQRYPLLLRGSAARG
jgi:hypothetical protein